MAEEIEIKPMNPERLAGIFGPLRVQDPNDDSPLPVWSDVSVRELLADRDHRAKGLRETLAHLVEGQTLLLESSVLIERLKGERNEARGVAKRWRSQCPVTDAHVDAAGVTYEKLDAWAAENSLAPARATDYQRHECRGASDVGWACEGIFHGYSASWPGNRGWATTGADIAGFITFACALFRCPAFDILDEMAKL